MISGFDTAAVMADGIGDAAAAWTFVRRFAQGWTTPLVDDGVSDAELDAAQQSLGVRLPSALRETYRLLGRRPDLTSNQDVLLAPGECCWDEAREVLMFRVENQDCARWGIRRADLAAEDPPVVFKAHNGWQAFLPRTSLAVVEMVLTETVMGGDLLDNACELPAELLALLTSQYQHLRFPDYPMWADPTSSPIRWYAAPGQLLRIDGTTPGSSLFARGQTDDNLRAICRTVPGDWAQYQGTEP